MLVEHLRQEEQWLEERVMRWLNKKQRRPEEVRFLKTEGATIPLQPSHGQVLTLTFLDGTEVSLHLFQLTDAERLEQLKRLADALSVLEAEGQPETRAAALAAARQVHQLFQEEVEGQELPPTWDTWYMMTLTEQ
jgi:hypothetical protein